MPVNPAGQNRKQARTGGFRQVARPTATRVAEEMQSIGELPQTNPTQRADKEHRNLHPRIFVSVHLLVRFP
jgi:hypothetical protein